MKQKWFKKRDRQVRYSISDEKLQEFDDRRLIDTRFWLFLCNVSNTYYQYVNTVKPMTPEQVEINKYYWVGTILVYVMLILSFVHSMVWIVPGIFYLTLRNAVPLFDFENRK
jgi:hypothetical protein